VKSVVFCVLMGLAGLGCTALDRAEIADDIAWFTGAPSSGVGDILTEIGKDIAVQGGDPIGTSGYIAGLLATIAGGYVARRLWKKRRAAQAPAAIIEALKEPESGEDIDE
jgi:hypothetical protein